MEPDFEMDKPTEQEIEKAASCLCCKKIFSYFRKKLEFQEQKMNKLYRDNYELAHSILVKGWNEPHKHIPEDGIVFNLPPLAKKE
jgi:hypothetical protein